MMKWAVTIAACFVIGIFALIWTVDYISCTSRWNESGMRLKWGPHNGCRLEVAPGKWIPAEAFRQTP